MPSSANDLIKKSQAGDQVAFGELMKENYGVVFNRIRQMIGNEVEAQEIAQVTWIKVWNKIESFRFESEFSSWLYRIATFTTLDAIRKNKRQRTISLDIDEDESANPEAIAACSIEPRQLKDLENKELRQHFEQSLEKLPPAHKEALILREIEGLSYQEISDRTHCKYGTVMSRIFNARKAIQNYMKDFLK
ncbi:sigma-70 family RNA polymerase sigma factor [Puniceicoccaceae bacterium K14]|nr:sigma-70 family RNA polymerase sigma factor [Puniceicoccaceae bacterium K14]